MILGLGTDLAEVERIRQSIERFGDRFLARVFTEQERLYCTTKRFPEQNLAARFAAKEAGAKALGTGIRQDVSWQEIEVRRRSGSPPELKLAGRALQLADAMGVEHISLSITHTDRYASAVVIFESR